MAKSKKTKGTPQTQKDQPSLSGYLGKFEEAPLYSKDNKHIHQGYRIGFETSKGTLKSLFMIHNETVNIWSHLIGFVIMFFLIFEVIAYEMESTHMMGKSLIQGLIEPFKASSESIPEMDPSMICAMLNDGLEEGESPFECLGMDLGQNRQMKPFSDEIPTWPVMVMLAGGAICLACSATFHLIYQMNESRYLATQKCSSYPPVWTLQASASTWLSPPSPASITLFIATNQLPRPTSPSSCWQAALPLPRR